MRSHCKYFLLPFFMSSLECFLYLKNVVFPKASKFNGCVAKQVPYGDGKCNRGLLEISIVSSQGREEVGLALHRSEGLLLASTMAFWWGEGAHQFVSVFDSSPAVFFFLLTALWRDEKWPQAVAIFPYRKGKGALDCWYCDCRKLNKLFVGREEISVH